MLVFTEICDGFQGILFMFNFVKFITVVLYYVKVLIYRERFLLICDRLQNSFILTPLILSLQFRLILWTYPPLQFFWLVSRIYKFTKNFWLEFAKPIRRKHQPFKDKTIKSEKRFLSKYIKSCIFIMISDCKYPS